MYTVLINQVAPVLFYAVLLLSLFMRIQNDITEPMLQVKSKDETKQMYWKSTGVDKLFLELVRYRT